MRGGAGRYSPGAPSGLTQIVHYSSSYLLFSILSSIILWVAPLYSLFLEGLGVLADREKKGFYMDGCNV